MQIIENDEATQHLATYPEQLAAFRAGMLLRFDNAEERSRFLAALDADEDYSRPAAVVWTVLGEMHCQSQLAYADQLAAILAAGAHGMD